MKKILIAFDGSEHAVKAVQEAKNLRVGFPDATVTILSVLDVAKAKDQALDFTTSAQERKQARIDHVKQQLNGQMSDCTITVLIGDPATEIIEYTKNESYDYLIIGSRGLNALQEFVLGSVSHKVVKHATLPVLVVK
ncbi:universal stress protein [Enterococcus aquimarinus]|nr:universal stress protein [Enterococcus aquimarinus]